jgi:hypothetical protein
VIGEVIGEDPDQCQAAGSLQQVGDADLDLAYRSDPALVERVNLVGSADEYLGKHCRTLLSMDSGKI